MEASDISRLHVERSNSCVQDSAMKTVSTRYIVRVAYASLLSPLLNNLKGDSL